MSGTSTSVVGCGVGCGYGFRPPFTAVQWQELEHQAMIYKYLVAGLPVPHALVVPIRRSFEAISSNFFHHPSLGYCSYYGRKLDPEPGRCRRTDGKKWRCSKDAHTDSKYCERHMHRGRTRSRKPVESQSTSQSLSTGMSHITTGSSSRSGSFQCSNNGGFQNMSLYSSANSEGLSYQITAPKLQMEPVSYGIDSKEYRYLHYRNFSTEASSVQNAGMGSNSDGTWCLMPSEARSNPMVKPKDDSQLLGSSPEFGLPNSFEPVIDLAISKQQHQHCFFGNDISSPGTIKQEQHPMRPFFDEWPTSKEPWSNLDGQGSNKNNFSSTQLSISTPIAPEFSSNITCSPNDA